MGAELGFQVLGLGLVPVEGDAGGDAVLVDPHPPAARRGPGGRGGRGLYARPPGPHEVRGTVVVGDRRGRELGFPTANLAVPARVCLPADGIYAGTFVGADGVERAAAISLGRRPDLLRGRRRRRSSRPTCSTSTATCTARR